MNNLETKLANHIATTEAAVAQQETLVNRASDAAKAMEIVTGQFSAEWQSWKLQSDAALHDLQQTRMAMDREWKVILAGLADVRKFFLQEEHVKEMTRLKEFVEVLKDLKVFKDSGFLDDVADVMLKLEATSK